PMGGAFLGTRDLTVQRTRPRRKRAAPTGSGGDQFDGTLRLSRSQVLLQHPSGILRGAPDAGECVRHGKRTFRRVDDEPPGIATRTIPSKIPLERQPRDGGEWYSTRLVAKWCVLSPAKD